MNGQEAERITEQAGDIAAEAKDKVERLGRLMPDSSEVADAVDRALESIGLACLAVETVADRRTDP